MDDQAYRTRSEEPGSGRMLAEPGHEPLHELLDGPAAAAAKRTNWSGNHAYSAIALGLPATISQLRGLVARSTKLKALGARHSFNDIADTSGDQLGLTHFDQIELDAAAATVALGAGVTYGELAPYLHSRGFAVHNLASLPHISVVGACSTATHGSGSSLGNLSTAVRSIEMVTANGDLKTLSRASLGSRFAGVVVALGALGVVTRITLAVEPSFLIEQTLYEDLSFDELEHNLDAIFASGYSVSLFTDWQRHRATQLWIKRRVERGAAAQQHPVEFFGAPLAKHKLHPLAGHPAHNCTEQLGVPGPWFERLPHFKMDFTPSSGAELQSEYFIPREHACQAILAVEQLRDRISPNLFVSEFRTIAADDLWISPCYQRASMAMHFTWKPDWLTVGRILPLIEEKLAPFAARPHWAKLFIISGKQLRSLYPRMDDFLALVAEYDPEGKFRNDFLERNLYQP